MLPRLALFYSLSKYRYSFSFLHSNCWMYQTLQTECHLSKVFHLLAEAASGRIIIWWEGDSSTDAHSLCAIWGSIITHLVIMGRGGGALSWDLIGGFPDAEIRLADSEASFLLGEPAPRWANFSKLLHLALFVLPDFAFKHTSYYLWRIETASEEDF